MKPDSMLVDPGMIVKATAEVVDSEREALDKFKIREPVLGNWIEREMLGLAGKMGLSGTAPEVIIGSHCEFTGILLTALEAVRHGHYALWKNSLSGTPLEATLGEEVEGSLGEAPADTEEPDCDDEADLFE